MWRPPSADRARRAPGTGSRPDAEAGFTLVEVLVALTMLMVISVALVPMLLGSLKAANAAKLSTQAKNLTAERIELMRNLPFHVAAANGNYIDVLDTYFRDLANPSTNTACDSAAYSSATSNYTCTLGAGKLNFPQFSQTITTQFLAADLSVLTPPAGYNTQVTGADLPVSTLLSATVTTSWKEGPTPRSYSVTTRLSDAQPSQPLVVSSLRATGVSVATTVDTDSSLLQFDAALVSADGSLSTGSAASGSAVGAQASTGAGEADSGQAAGTVDTPPDGSLAGSTGTASSGPPCSRGWSCYGPSTTATTAASVSGGVPVVGASTAPLSASLTKSGSGSSRGFTFSSVSSAAAWPAALTRLQVPAGTALVAMPQSSPNNGYSVGCGTAPVSLGSADFATSTGWLSATRGSAHSVTSCATSTGRQIQLFPTTFAPAGVVQITLDRAALSCTTTGATASVTADWSARVSYWTSAGAYTTLTVTPGSTDPLAGVSLTVGAGGVQVGLDPSGQPLYLGDYIASWAGLLAVSGGSQSGGLVAQADLKGVVRVATQPTRDADPTSVLDVSVGTLSCLAEDNR